MSDLKLSPFNRKADMNAIGEQMGVLRNLEPKKIKDSIAIALAMGKLSDSKCNIRAGLLKEHITRRANGEPDLKFRELEKDFD